MRSRFLLLASVIASVSVVGCMDHDHYGYDDDNEIVFGIRQKVDADGNKHVSAGYEFLALAKKGGWVTNAFRDGDGEGTCYFERFDHRLGKPRVESGVATFKGAGLPAPGLQVLANQPEPAKLEGTGWSTGEVLTFDAAGFAMPDIRPVTMKAPRTELAITGVTPAVAQGSTELSLKPTDSIAVTWTPIEDERSTRVMVALETDEEKGPGGEVRCFGSGKSGSAIIPSEWVARLFSSVDPSTPVNGRLEIATHRQVTVRARGGWTVYVVATTVHREQSFR
jgi:hypothetical protein